MSSVPKRINFEKKVVVCLLYSYIYMYSYLETIGTPKELTYDSHTSPPKIGKMGAVLARCFTFFIIIIVAEQHSLTPTLMLEEPHVLGGD